MVAILSHFLILRELFKNLQSTKQLSQTSSTQLFFTFFAIRRIWKNMEPNPTFPYTRTSPWYYHVVKNTLLLTVFPAIFPTGNTHYIHMVNTRYILHFKLELSLLKTKFWWTLTKCKTQIKIVIASRRSFWKVIMLMYGTVFIHFHHCFC